MSTSVKTAFALSLLISSQTSHAQYFDTLGGMALSDRNQKDNIVELQDSLTSIKRIHGYNFTYKNDPAQRVHMGVIAQEVQSEFPHAVRAGIDGNLHVSYDALVPALIEALQELNQKVENQQLEIDRLKRLTQ